MLLLEATGGGILPPRSFDNTEASRGGVDLVVLYMKGEGDEGKNDDAPMLEIFIFGS
jgi:hypothetical protein